MKEAGRYSIATPNSLATRGIPFLWSPIPDRQNSARILRFPPTHITGRNPVGQLDSAGPSRTRRGAHELTRDSQLTPGEDFFILGG